jgi:D-serine deaminase-like pyridoxal phosphate-dependent protein
MEESITMSVMPELQEYQLVSTTDIATPALLVYPKLVEHNINVTLRWCDGDANRWRPHVKTVKLASVMKQYIAMGLRQFKCATPLELETLCKVGAADALLAFPVMGANARRVRELAQLYPSTRVSVLIETAEQLDLWRDSAVGIFIDVNPGMNRSGLQREQRDQLVPLIRGVQAAGLTFRGLHWYDGHRNQKDFEERTRTAHADYNELMVLVAQLEKAGVRVEEVITAGTPAFPCSLSYDSFRDATFVHRISPGTIGFYDVTTMGQLPASMGFDYKPAAVVLTMVVSRPTPVRITCDGGHKAVSADAGVPTCAVIGHTDWSPAGPSEEHLPIDLPAGAAQPAVGENLYLVPKHICPSVNLHDYALLVDEGRVLTMEHMDARGHHPPLR